MLQVILYIIGTCTVIFILMVKFSAKPYPKKWEEEENKEFEKKLKEYEQKKGEN